MRALIFLFVLSNFQQIFAGKYATFDEFKHAESKERPTVEFLDTIDMVIPEFMKTKNFAEMKARLALKPKRPLPDFDARKTTLKEVRAKLEIIRQAALNTDLPDKALLGNAKQILAGMIDQKLEPFKLPELTEQVEPLRFVDGFGEDLIEVHNTSETVHRELLASSGRARHYMVEQVFNVFGSLVFVLARGTEEMMRLRTEVQELIIRDTALEADPECIEELEEGFASINQYFGNELNRCARYAYYPARRYVNTIFYPYLNYVVDEINSLHYVVLGMMARGNVARDQESVLRVLDTVIQGDRKRYEMFAQEVLYWEGNAFADAHINYVQTMEECGNDVIRRHTIGNDFIVNQYNVCLFRKK